MQFDTQLDSNLRLTVFARRRVDKATACEKCHLADVRPHGVHIGECWSEKSLLAS